MVRRYLLFTCVLAAFLIVATGVQQREVKAADADRIKFSHSLHVEEAGLGCVDCHVAAATSTLASDKLSSTHDNCQSCHEDKLEDQCGYCHTNADNPGPPQAVRELLFSHKQHNDMPDIDCITCHTDVTTSTDVQTLAVPAMATCNTCHNDRKASNTCESCHTNFVALLPADHKQSDFLRTHRDGTRLGALTTSCQTCHAETFCQQCHLGLGLKTFGGRDQLTEPAGRQPLTDSPRQTRLQNVHDLNYRFTHGIDAKSRQAECASCHTTQEFCVQCHQAGGNINQARFKPASHGVPGFTTLGRGSGGGVHAEEARRDMESCITCHDVQGRDPSCMTCHLSTGGVR